MNTLPLPLDPDERKNIPLYSGLFALFPDVLVEVARLSKIGSERHNPGGPIYWSRNKSPDHEDCLLRHLLEIGRVDNDGVRHCIKVVWRAMALAQLELEREAASSKDSAFETYQPPEINHQ